MMRLLFAAIAGVAGVKMGMPIEPHTGMLHNWEHSGEDSDGGISMTEFMDNRNEEEPDLYANETEDDIVQEKDEEAQFGHDLLNSNNVHESEDAGEVSYNAHDLLGDDADDDTA